MISFIRKSPWAEYTRHQLFMARISVAEIPEPDGPPTTLLKHGVSWLWNIPIVSMLIVSVNSEHRNPTVFDLCVSIQYCLPIWHRLGFQVKTSTDHLRVYLEFIWRIPLNYIGNLRWLLSSPNTHQREDWISIWRRQLPYCYPERKWLNEDPFLNCRDIR